MADGNSKESVGPHQEIQAKKRMGWATCREFNQFKRERRALTRRAGAAKRERAVCQCQSVTGDGGWCGVVRAAEGEMQARADKVFPVCFCVVRSQVTVGEDGDRGETAGGWCGEGCCAGQGGGLEGGGGALPSAPVLLHNFLPGAARSITDTARCRAIHYRHSTVPRARRVARARVLVVCSRQNAQWANDPRQGS